MCSFSDRNECASSPCVNGKCIDVVNGYRCECQSGYTGTVCDEGKGGKAVQTLFLRRHKDRLILLVAVYRTLLLAL